MDFIAAKDTGNYRLRLEGDEDGLVLYVTYTGAWSSGNEVEVWLEPYEDMDDVEAPRWFERQVRGDLDVISLLVAAGYDEYGNARRGVAPVRI